jgi:cell division protein FtsL
MSDFLSWVTHGVKRDRFELDSRAGVTLFTVVAVLMLVAAVYLVLVSRTAAQGRYIEWLQGEVCRLQRENEQTEVRIAEASAFTRVMSRAEALGFVPAEQVEFLPGVE